MLLVMIGFGGALGALARYHLTRWIHSRVGAGFPWGTLGVNLSGSFLLGLMLPLLASGSESEPAFLHGFVAVGVLGAFTTFSTFAFEALALFESGEGTRAAVYGLVSVGMGLLSILLGLLLGARIF